MLGVAQEFIGKAFAGGMAILGIIPLGMILLRLLMKPLKLAVKLALHAIFGFVTLTVVNFFGAGIGLSVDITLTTALISGFFGIPGVIGIVLFHLFV